MPVIRGLLYVILQCIGAIAGSGILRALSPERMEHALGVVSLSPGVTPVQGFGIEFFLAFVLVLVVCGACDAAKPDSKGIAPLIIGLSVSVGHIIGVRYKFNISHLFFCLAILCIPFMIVIILKMRIGNSFFRRIFENELAHIYAYLILFILFN